MPEILDRRISFNAGEISPWLDPRIDLDKYRMGCRELQNMRPSIYGGAIRRPGTQYIGRCATDTGDVRLISFTREISTNYVLEFSNLKFRVWNTQTMACEASIADAAWATGQPYVVGDVLSQAGNNYEVLTNHTSGTFATDLSAARLRIYYYQEIASPYTAAQLEQIQSAQQNDVLFLSHPDHFPRLVTRFDDGRWKLTEVNIDWPVTLGHNLSLTTITPLVDIYSASEPVAWTAASDTVGTLHKYDGKYYIAVTATTSSDIPGTAAALGKWVEGRWIAAAGPTTPAYSSSIKYVAGTLVTWNGKTYVRTSLYSGTVKDWNPGKDYDKQQLWDEANPPAVETALGMVPKGGNIILKSSAPVWESTHVGTKWIVGHRRQDLKASFRPHEQAIGYVTGALYVLGEWTAQISQTQTSDNAFTVDVLIERSTDLINWETHYSLHASSGDVQQLLTGTEEQPLFLRVKLLEKTGSLPTGGGALTTSLVAGNPMQHGIVQINTVTSSTQVEATVITPIYRYLPTTTWEEPAWTGVFGYPRAVTLHENRLFYGGNKRKPTTVWGSAIDAYGDFRVASADDRAVSYTLASDESSAIEWLVSQDMLVIGTSSGEWVMGARPGDEAPKLRRNTSFGSAPIQARAIADALVFVQRSRRKVREFAWSFERDGYQANDLVMLSEHLGDLDFRQIAIQRNPESVVWVVTATGDLLSLTYERGQNVAGWARHTTDGDFKSVAVVFGGGMDDHVWLIVRRTIEGQARNYIERFQPDVVAALKNGTVADYTFVDSAFKRTGAPTTSLSGLEHLAGKTVSVMGDGKPQADRVVASNGTMTILSASTVIVGLPYESRLEPTALETPDPSSMTKLGKKRLHRAVVEFWKSDGMEISADGGSTWFPFVFPITPTFNGAAGTLFSGLHEIFLDSSHERQTSLMLRQKTPSPLAVMGIGMRYNVEMS